MTTRHLRIVDRLGVVCAYVPRDVPAIPMAPIQWTRGDDATTFGVSALLLADATTLLLAGVSIDEVAEHLASLDTLETVAAVLVICPRGLDVEYVRAEAVSALRLVLNATHERDKREHEATRKAYLQAKLGVTT